MQHQRSNAQLSPYIEAAVFAAISFFALIPGLNRGLILDEYKTRMVAALPWRNLFEDRLASGHLPTYFSMIKIWTAIFGDTEVSLRLPGIILVALATPFVYLFVRRITTVRAARLAALIFAFHQQISWVGQTARPYNGLLLFELVLFWAAAEWWHSPKRRWLIAIAVSTLMGMAFMPLYALVPIAIVLGTLPFARRCWSRFWPMILTITLALGVALLPSLFLASTQTRLSANQSSLPDLPKMFDGLADMVYGDYQLWSRGIMQYIAAALLLGAFILLWRNRKLPAPHSAAPAIPWRTWLLFWIFVPMLALTIAGGITGESMVSHLRYRTPALGAVIVVLAISLDYFLSLSWPRPLRYFTAILILLPVFITTAAWWRQPGEGMREVITQMLQTDGGIPRQVAGHGRWFRMELPDNKAPARELFLERAITNRNDDFIDAAKLTGHDVDTLNYNKDSNEIEPIRAKLTVWAQGDPFWLFVYIQRKDALDKVAKNPPDGYRLDNEIRFEDTRAYHFSADTHTTQSFN